MVNSKKSSKTNNSGNNNSGNNNSANNNSGNSKNSSNSQTTQKKSKKMTKQNNTANNKVNNTASNIVSANFVSNNKTKDDSHNLVLKEFIKRMLESIHAIKLYHWNTKSHSTPKATDALHAKLSELVDHYVEVFIGKIDAKLKMSDYTTLTLKNLSTNKEMEKFIIDLIDFLTTVHTKLDMDKDTDFLNIRDEIVGELNQFLYLLRMV